MSSLARQAAWPLWVHALWIVLVAVGTVALVAQETDDPAALKAQLAQKDAQIAALKATPAQQLDQAKASYAATFKAAKMAAEAGCKAAGGHLWVMVTQGTAARPTVSVSCEF